MGIFINRLSRFGMCGCRVLPMVGLEFLGVTNCWFEVSNGLLSRLACLQLGVTIYQWAALFYVFPIVESPL